MFCSIASAQVSGNSKLLRITDIQNNRVNWDNVPFCQITDKEFGTYGLNNRDIMIARTGGTIGKTYIVENLCEKAVFASYLIRAIPTYSINEKYLKTFLESPFYWQQLKEKSMGTGQPNVNGTALKELIVIFPPLAEQERIVEKVDKLMALCNILSDEKGLSKYKSIAANVITFMPQDTNQEKYDEFDMVARAESIKPETQVKMSERLKMLRTKK